MTLLTAPASAFVANGRWSFTAEGGPTGLTGSPTILTWSLVPDGTNMPGEGPSNLISFLNTNFGSGTEGVETSPWFIDILQPTFNRWAEVSGLTFRYEENDDGASHGNFSGQANIRGDIRLGGVFLGGPGGTDARAWGVPNGDITIDTQDPVFFSNPTDNFRNFRNTLMHEIGHSLGLGHLDSPADFLMETGYDSSLDGLQIDDIRGVQQLYGDRYERDENGPNPNNSLATATSLGSLAFGQPLAIGLDAGATTVVTASQSDFVSVANLNDVDFYSFDVAAGGLLDVVLSPTGPNYYERPFGAPAYSLTRSSQVSDLRFELYGPLAEGGIGLLASANSAAIGFSESISQFPLTKPGEYSVKVSGTTNLVQLYQLHLSLDELDADFDVDGDTDGADFLAWQRGLNNPFTEIELDMWEAAYGSAQPLAKATSVPEPLGLSMAVISLLVAATLRKAQWP